jgi:aconitate hydratase
VGDNVTTDHIMPAGAQVLPLRSNIPAIAEYVFWRVDPDFVQRAKEWGGGMVVGGVNYGQGSSREHAALAPMYLGLKAVSAKSFARIHHANLVNVGILPLTFADEADFDGLEQGDEWEIAGVRAALQKGDDLTVRNLTKGTMFEVTYNLTGRQVKVLLGGGLLNYIKAGGQ